MQINLSVSAFSGVVIFGDSLSDTGNHQGALLPGGLPWPYYENRISNGPVAVDRLAAGLGYSADSSQHVFGRAIGWNYAVSGANAAGSEVQDLGAQVDAFLGRPASGIDPGALYVVMIGGNDLRDASVMESAALSVQAVDAAVDSIYFALVELIDKGARNILVANGPDIGKIPETRERSASHLGLEAWASTLTQKFNTRLSTRLDQLSATPGVNIVRFDLYARFNEILARASFYGFTNSRDACFRYDSFSFHPDCDFERFVFFDKIHPTAKVHRLLGQSMLDIAQGLEEGTGSRIRLRLPGIFGLLLE